VKTSERPRQDSNLRPTAWKALAQPPGRSAASAHRPATRLGRGVVLGFTDSRGVHRPIAYLSPHEGVRELRDMDRLLTAGEIAERLGMRIDWVWAQARAGRIPHVRLGRYRRFRESAVEAWLQELETGGSPTPPNARSNTVPLRRRA
jgi:excisionase family DNA binding protein